MELIKNENGIGTLSLVKMEVSDISSLKDIFTAAEKLKERSGYSSLSEGSTSINIDHDKNAAFAVGIRLNGLFPFLEFDNKENAFVLFRGYADYTPGTTKYFPKWEGEQVDELRFSLRINHNGCSYGDRDKELYLLLPKKKDQCYVALLQKEHGEKGESTVIDDVVKILGKSHAPHLNGWQELPKKPEVLSLGEFPYLEKTLELYVQADEVLPRGGKSENELTLLKKAASEEKNLAVRELSLQVYHQKLAEFLLK